MITFKWKFLLLVFTLIFSQWCIYSKSDRVTTFVKYSLSLVFLVTCPLKIVVLTTVVLKKKYWIVP